MNLLSMSDDEILEAVNPLMDNLMAGSTEIDHDKHTGGHRAVTEYSHR